MERWRDRGGARVRFSGGIARRKYFADRNGGNCGDVGDAICDRIVARCQQRVSQQFQRESTLKRGPEGRIGAHGGRSKSGHRETRANTARTLRVLRAGRWPLQRQFKIKRKDKFKTTRHTARSSCATLTRRGRDDGGAYDCAGTFVSLYVATAMWRSGISTCKRVAWPMALPIAP